MGTVIRDTVTALDPDWAGAFERGYDDQDVARFFTHVHEKTGVRLACVWGYRDVYGYGGDSNWYVQEDESTTLYNLDGSLWPWVFGDNTQPEGRNPRSWKGEAETMFRAVTSDGWNWVPEPPS